MGTVKNVELHTEQSLLPMIAKMSYETFNKLPYSEREGISIEDLMADAKIVIITKAAKTYKPQSQVKFSTYAYKILENHFKGLLRDSYASKRCAILYSLDFKYRDNPSNPDSKMQTLYDRMARSQRHVMENRIIARIDAERGFIKAYTVATPMLRKYLICWLLQPKATSKVKEGNNASAAMAEFKNRSVKFITEEMCQTIQRDYVCRDAIANKLVSKFFTPVNGSVTTNPNFTLRKVVEYRVLPILSPERQASIMALV